MPRLATLSSSLALLLLACSEKQSGPDSESGSSTSGTTTELSASSTGSQPTTGDAMSTDPATGEPVSSSEGGEATSGTSGPQPDAGSAACDVWSQDCPDGQKCMPVDLDDEPGSETTLCVPVVVDPDPLDGRCTVIGGGGGLDSCAEGLLCWRVNLATPEGICVALCGGSERAPTCPDPQVACELDTVGDEHLCLRHCDPLAQDCPGDNLCVATGGELEFLCVNDASGDGGQLFGPCGAENTCDEGLFCGSAIDMVECDGGSETCCTPYCDLNVDPDPCPGQGQHCSPLSGDPRPGDEDVGTCVVPPL